MSDYKNIKVPPDVFEALKEHKRPGESWGLYLRRYAEQQEGPP
jgi:predicted CopG family antitoxin